MIVRLRTHRLSVKAISKKALKAFADLDSDLLEDVCVENVSDLDHSKQNSVFSKIKKKHNDRKKIHVHINLFVKDQLKFESKQNRIENIDHREKYR